MAAVLWMAGKIILWILLALLVLLIIAMLIPVKVRFQYETGEILLAVRYGPVKLQVLPPEEKPKGEGKKPPKKKKPKSEKPKKPKTKINREQIFYALEKLPPIMGRALKRTGRSIHIKPLKLYILAAGPDPADTAQLYGRLEAALAAGFPIMEKVLRLKDTDVRLFVDFQAEQMDFIADIGVWLRPGSLVWMALRAGGSLLKWFLGFRKLASPATGADEDKLDQADKKDQPETEKSDHEAA